MLSGRLRSWFWWRLEVHNWLWRSNQRCSTVSWLRLSGRLPRWSWTTVMPAAPRAGRTWRGPDSCGGVSWMMLSGRLLGWFWWSSPNRGAVS